VALRPDGVRFRVDVRTPACADLTDPEFVLLP